MPKGFEARQLHEDKEFDRYLNCVSYVDEFIGDVIALLEEQGVYEDTVIVIVGDHGEGFGEHSRYYHDNVIYQEALKIPILYHGPGVPAGERIEQVSNQLDILPTLSHLAGFELEGTFEGVQVLDNQKVAQPRELTSYCWYERACAAHFQWPYKYVYHFDQHPDELYNLLDDPKERTNLLDTKSHHTLPDHIDPKEMKSTLLDTLEKAQAHHQASGE